MKSIDKTRAITILAWLIIIGSAPKLNACIESCDGEVVLNRLSGFLVQGDRPLKGVTIDIFQAKPCSPPLNKRVRTLTTGDAGNFDVGTLSPGTYRVAFNVSGETRELIIKFVTAKKTLQSVLFMTLPNPGGTPRMGCTSQEVKFHVLDKS